MAGSTTLATVAIAWMAGASGGEMADAGHWAFDLLALQGVATPVSDILSASGVPDGELSSAQSLGLLAFSLASGWVVGTRAGAPE